MAAFQQLSACIFSPFLSILLVTNNVLISFHIIKLQAVVSFIVKEEVSFSLTLFFNYYFPPFMLANFINPFSLILNFFCSLLPFCPLQSLATSLTCPLAVVC